MKKENKYDFPIVDDTLYPHPLTCDSCKKKFCHAIRTDEGERFCKNCYNHRYGLEDTLEVCKALDAMSNHLWEVPFDELTPEVKAKVKFVVRGNKPS
jgi:hypothetical protein